MLLHDSMFIWANVRQATFTRAADGGKTVTGVLKWKKVNKCRMSEAQILLIRTVILKKNNRSLQVLLTCYMSELLCSLEVTLLSRKTIPIQLRAG